jgi:DNA primase
VLGDALPKYLNTPETPLFKKGELLYGLDRARAAIRETGEVIVVEGYMDVLALHQTGFGNAVAALGANLTGEQAEALTRLDAQRVLLAFDADEAGQRAVLAGLEQSVGRRFLVQAVRLPSGKDPADAVLAGSVEREAFAAALRSGVSEVAFRFERVLAQHDAATPRASATCCSSCCPRCSPATSSIRSPPNCAGWSSTTSRSTRPASTPGSPRSGPSASTRPRSGACAGAATT